MNKLTHSLLCFTMASTTVAAVAEVPSVLIKTHEQQTYHLDGLNQRIEPFEVPGFSAKTWQVIDTQDFDNDHMQDFLLKHRESGSLIVAPNPHLSERRPYELPFTLQENHSVQIGDVDADGAKDIIIFDHKLNEISAIVDLHAKPEVLPLLTPRFPVQALQAFQIDNDDRVDFIHIGEESAHLFLSNTHNSEAFKKLGYSEFEINFKADGTLHSPFFVDLNGDDKKDVVFKSPKHGLVAYEFFSGSDGHIGLGRIDATSDNFHFVDVVGSYDIDGDQIPELATLSQRDHHIQFHKLADKNWKPIYEMPLELKLSIIDELIFFPVPELPWFNFRYVGVDQLNEYIPPFVLQKKFTSGLATPELTLDILEPFEPRIIYTGDYYRADFGVDILEGTKVVSYSTSYNVASAVFTKLVPVNGILTPSTDAQDRVVANINNQRVISAELPQGQYRLRVKHHNGLADILTLSRFVSDDIQKEVARLFPFVVDPVTNASMDRYLKYKLATNIDSDDYYDQVAFFTENNPSKRNFQSWFDYNDIDNKTVTNAVYINSGDLGFARNMFITKKDAQGRVFSWVENYETLPEAVAASRSYKSNHGTYEPSPFGIYDIDVLSAEFTLNNAYISFINPVDLELISPVNIRDLLFPGGVKRDGLIATVVMEYHPSGTEKGRLVSFFVFDGKGDLINLANLDGRGAKPNPGVCMNCHGGSGQPNEQGDVGAGFIPWDLDSFIYAKATDYTRQVQLNNFWGMNKEVQAMYPNSDPISELVDDWYPGNLPSNATHFDGDAVMPSDFSNNSEEALYKRVTATSCRMCHLQPAIRNTDIGNNVGMMKYGVCSHLDHTTNKNDNNRYAAQMPHAYLTFKNLWSRGYMDEAKKVNCTP